MQYYTTTNSTNLHIIKIHPIQVAQHLRYLLAVLQHRPSCLRQMIQRRIPAQRLTERDHGAHLDLHDAVRTPGHRRCQPILQVLGEIANRLRQRTGYRTQHVRQQHVDHVLVERVVDFAHKLLDGRALGERVQFVFAQVLFLLALIAVVVVLRAPELAPQRLDQRELKIEDSVEKCLAVLAVHGAQRVDVVERDVVGQRFVELDEGKCGNGTMTVACGANNLRVDIYGFKKKKIFAHTYMFR